MAGKYQKFGSDLLYAIFRSLDRSYLINNEIKDLDKVRGSSVPRTFAIHSERLVSFLDL